MFKTTIRCTFFIILSLWCLIPSHSAHAAEKWVNILAFFGTSVPEAKVSLDAIEKSYAQNGEAYITAYTSDIIRKKLEKQGQKILSVNAALNKASAMGFKNVRVQSFHVGAAEEFYQLQRMILKNIHSNPKRFTHVLLGYPLMSSGQDLYEVRDVLLQNLAANRKENEAVVFMGHGNHHGPGDIMLYALGKALQEKDDLIYVASVEGSNTFAKVLQNLKAKNIKKVWLQPFMIVAGDHARNDMAGPEPDSWLSQLQAAGIEGSVHMLGLGQMQGIQNIFLRHTKDAYDDMAKSKKSD